jgi:hypothetical protein
LRYIEAFATHSIVEQLQSRQRIAIDLRNECSRIGHGPCNGQWIGRTHIPIIDAIGTNRDLAPGEFDTGNVVCRNSVAATPSV